MDLQKRPLIFSILKNGRFFYLGILYGAWVSRRDPTTRSASPLQGIPCSKHCERAFKYDAKSSDFVDHFDGPRHIKKKNAALKVQSQGNSWLSECDTLSGRLATSDRPGCVVHRITGWHGA